MKCIFGLFWCMVISVATTAYELDYPSSDTKCPDKQWLCGDQCVAHFHQCQCGSEFTSLLPNKVCCNTEPCFGNDTFIQCPDGILQDETEVCNTECRTTFSNSKTVWCQEDQKCVKEVDADRLCVDFQKSTDSPQEVIEIEVLSSEIKCMTGEWLCGDQCVSHFHQCQCGATFNSLLPDKICCTNQPCEEVTVGNYTFTQCLEGIVQSENEVCNGECPTTFSNFKTVWCQESQECVKEKEASRLCEGYQESEQMTEIDTNITYSFDDLALSSEVTCKAREWVCGDQCVSAFHQCQCGTDFANLLPNKICCNTQPCFKNGNVTQCPDGVVQSENELCNGVCRTTYSNIRTMWCQDRCIKDQQEGTGFCKGQQKCPDSETEKGFCTNLPTNDYCIKGEENQCPQIRGSKHRNRECAKESIIPVFHCLNRMDQFETLFSQRSKEEINLNLLLDYTDKYFRCNEHNVTWQMREWSEDKTDESLLALSDIVIINHEQCLLKDGKTKIELRKLYKKISDDFSFKLRDKAEILQKWSS